jgi:hypothetical protein
MVLKQKQESISQVFEKEKENLDDPQTSPKC